MSRLERVALVAAAFVVLTMCCVGWFDYIVLNLRVGQACDQTSYFVEMTQIAAHKAVTPEAIDAYIESVKNYYPSGSKQKVGSALDVIVERARSQAVRQLEHQKAMLKQEQVSVLTIDTSAARW